MNLIRKKKILFFINSYSDYLDDFVKALQKSFNVKVFLKYENTIYTKYKTKSKKNYYLVNKKNFKKKLETFSPEIIIVGGLNIF